jgi:hypothetical protein
LRFKIVTFDGIYDAPRKGVIVSRLKSCVNPKP